MVQIGSNWECPYCGKAQVLADERVHEAMYEQHVEEWKGDTSPVLHVLAIVCANQACRELTLKAVLGKKIPDKRNAYRDPIKNWTLLPPSSAKPQPDYIPKVIRDDYNEACAIRDLSPKASATIMRRCLQGMIRDFCKISKPRLIDEIKELRKRVDSGHAPPGVLPDSVDAIDNVRNIGNIGAHMEAKINVIVDVDPNEAQTLIELVETLLEEWYVAAEARKARFGHLKKIAADIKQKKKGPAKESVSDMDAEKAKGGEVESGNDPPKDVG
jgi:hypothetical protein